MSTASVTGFPVIDVTLPTDFPLDPPQGAHQVLPAGVYTCVQTGPNSGEYSVYPQGKTSGVKLANVGIKVVVEDGVMVARIS